MNNYEYIIASLPVPGKDAGALDADALTAEILGLLSSQDQALASLLLESFNPDSLDSDYYIRAHKSSNAFIREYSAFDLKVRNAKVDYLNELLGRPQGQDIMPLPEGVDGEFDLRPEVDAVLSRTDILDREKGLDDLMWAKADELVEMHVLDLDVILAFIAKIKITDRWNKLDSETGRQLFRKLVQEIRNIR